MPAAPLLLGGLVLAAVLLGAARLPGPLAVASSVALLGYLTAAGAAWARRPGHRAGALFVLGGVAVLAAALAGSPLPLLAGVGVVVDGLPLAVACELLLALPSGVVRGRARRLRLVAYVGALGLQVPQYLFGGAADAVRGLALLHRPELGTVAAGLQAGLGALVVALALRAGPRRPRAREAWVVPVAALLLLAHLAGAFPGLAPGTVVLVQVGLLAGVPAVFGVVVGRGGFPRAGGMVELARWPGPAGGQGALQARLRSALGDPSLTLRLWSAEGARFPGGPGRPGALRVEIRLDRAPVCLVEYDGDLLADRRVVVAAGRVVAAVVDRERLAATLRLQQEELGRAREQLATAVDGERRRIGHDLHDGVQGWLVLAGLRLAELGRHADPELRTALAEVRAQLDAAGDQLRWLSAGVLPPLLTRRGLFEAVEELVDQLPLPVDLRLPPARRFPALVELTAYFGVAEALTNVLKHAGASRVGVRVGVRDNRLVVVVEDDGAGGAVLRPGGGLAGVAERLGVLGGQLSIRSAPGGGTGVSLEMPCGW